MFYYLHLLTDWFSPLRMFRYITLRAFLGAATAFLLVLVLGPLVIRWLRRLNFGEQSRDGDVEKLAEFFNSKKGTPTMGGALIIFATIGATLLWADPGNGYVLLTLATMLYMGLLGFWDDFLKVTKKNAKGVPARYKFFWQTVWVAVLLGILLAWPETRRLVRQLFVPFFKEPVIADMGLLCTFAFLWLVIVGASNAVNLTDGLDGLAVGCSNSVAVAYLAMAYVAGNLKFATYLQVPHLPGVGELAVLCGCLLGAGLGFLWYNCHPAQVFMGDTGSLAIGGTIGIVAVLIKQEIALIIVGGVFVIEAVSVVLQVASFRLTGRRIFLCSPLHHHFQWKEKLAAQAEGRAERKMETKITIRFWILSIIFALIGVAMLKIR
ncbi:MAG: phospho-N-acetylmuramoyl-pentapeptide-transferase [Verrucomicrobia bacterium]|nr:MAG: phospho-N-acetylmuramoyl-pentapeptide-transferase [Verrucomicrobiota bacterium]